MQQLAAVQLASVRLPDPAREVEQLVSAIRSFSSLGWWSRKDGQKHHHDAPTAAAAAAAAAAAPPLQQALEAAAVVEGGIKVWRRNILSSSPSLIQFGGIAATVTSILSPQGPGCCDHNGKERVANIVTSVPYLAIGVDSFRRRRTAAGKAWAASICGVGLGSLTFHVSSGRWRAWGRRLDYWAIALSSCMLARATFPRDLPPALTAAGAAATPFAPFLVSALNTLAMEVRFLRRAAARPALRPAQRAHSAAALGAMALFTLEDAAPRLPFVHASWHCLSALGVAHINAALQDAEQQQQQQPPQRRQRQGARGLPVQPLAAPGG